MSESVSRPESLVVHTVEALKQQIRAGRHGEALPGEPRLASQLSVARGTLRKALDILTGEGWISASHVGIPRRVLVKSLEEKRKATFVVGVLIPRALDELFSGTQHFLRDLASLTEESGIQYVYHPSAATRHHHPARSLKALLAEHPADLWLLYDASPPVARFFRVTETPAIVCGGPAVDEGLSYCGFDGLAAVRHAIGVFSRAGHTRIVSATRFQRPLREAVFREEFAKRGLTFDLQTHMPCWNNDLDQLHDLLRTRLSAPDRPTAWIINGLEGLVVFFSTLLELGIRVPRDISLLSIGSDPMLSCFRPSISHYSTPHRDLALAVARVIRAYFVSPAASPVVKLLQTEFVRGGSVGASPSQTMLLGGD